MHIHLPLPTAMRPLLPYPIVLGDSIELWQLLQPTERYIKRMRITPKKKCSIAKFVTVTQPQLCTLDAAYRASAAARREEYVPDYEFCEPCNRRRVMDVRQAFSVCVKCAEMGTGDFEDRGYREGAQVHTPYLYQKKNHFRDHLSRSQGKQSTEIDPEVLTAIRTELAKRYYSKDSSGQHDFSNVKQSEVKTIMKQLEMDKLYNHCTRVWALVTGNVPLQMTAEQEAELLQMFSMIEREWEAVKPPNRKNMLSYKYLINKMCLLLGYDELATQFSLLKSSDKRVFQDNCWKQLCQRVGFVYQPSS